MNTRTGEIALFCPQDLPTLAGFDKMLTAREALTLNALTAAERVEWAKAQPRQSPPTPPSQPIPRRFKVRPKIHR